MPDTDAASLEPLAVTRRMLTYIDGSPTPFHAVMEAQSLLDGAGYTELKEEDRWSLSAGDRRYVIRNGSTLVAFEVGSEAPADAGYRLVGAHTDSPNLRLKPNPSLTKDGYRQLGVEPYGGVLLAPWLDRDLSLAGRVVVAGEDSPRVFRVDRPLCRVANVAIHLNRDVNSKGLQLNKQKHLAPLFGLAEAEKKDELWFEAFLAGELGLSGPEAILGFDLMLYDIVPSTISGMNQEFVHAPRLDNLGSCHAALEALVAASAAGPAKVTRGIALYDNEEVGSRSAEGADSPFLAAVLERVSLALGGTAEDRHRATARSLFVSADMAHAVHPNYADLHEPQHMPKLNAGPVLKINSNLRYATLGTTGGAFARYAREADVPLQRFLNRSDLACGSTIGPITASRLGMPTVDVGNPMLSMHSVREMCGSQDQAMMVKVLTRHFRD